MTRRLIFLERARGVAQVRVALRSLLAYLTGLVHSGVGRGVRGAMPPVRSRQGAKKGAKQGASPNKNGDGSNGTLQSE